MTVKAKCSSLILVCLILSIQIATVSCTRPRVRTHTTGNVSKFITVNGLKHYYHLYIPDTHHEETAVPLVRMEPDTDPEDGTRVQKSVYSQCTDGAEGVLYTIEGGGHTWPGGYQYLPEFLIGKTSKDVDATKTIWAFFNEYQN